MIARALAKQPDDRYETCGELVDDARRALGLDEPQRPGAARARAGGRRAAGGRRGGDRVSRCAPGSGARGGADRVGRPHRSGERIREGDATGSRRIRRRSPSGPQVWVADFRQGTLWRIDPRTGDADQHRGDRQPARRRDPRRARLRRQRRPVAARWQRHPLRRADRQRASTASTSCPAASPPATASPTPPAVPTCNRLSTGPGKLRQRHRTRRSRCRRRRRRSTCARRSSASPWARARSGRSVTRSTTASSRSRRAAGRLLAIYRAADRAAEDRRRSGSDLDHRRPARRARQVRSRAAAASSGGSRPGGGTDGVAVGAGSVWVASAHRRPGRAHRSREWPDRRRASTSAPGCARSRWALTTSG